MFAAGAGFLFGGAATASPRVVSLNPCLDAVLVRVADRAQIAALSHYARDPQASGIVDLARTLPFTYESAEEVVALRPDLVLSSQHSSPATRQALTSLGVRTELFTVPESVDESLAQIRRIAALTGHPDRGEALISAVNKAIGQAAPPSGFEPISALVFQPNGFAAGRGTLIDEMMRRTGFINVADRYGLQKWGNVTLERLLMSPPQVLLSGGSGAGSASWAARVVDHPALASLSGRMVQADFPERLLYCGGPTLIETAAALVKARQLVLERRR